MVVPEPDRFNDILGRAYQARTPGRERRRQGEFYTPEWLADELLAAAGYDGSGSLCDPACGSGVFLLRALARRADAVVSGYETNPIAVEMAQAQWSRATGFPVDLAPVRLRDTITDPPDIRFDLVAGNPPWINWRHLDAESRLRLGPLWKRNGLLVHRGLRARLGSGMDDLSALAAYVWADRLVRSGGRLALILPETLFRSAGGGAGFRRFELPGGRFLRVLEVRDFGNRRCFPGGVGRPALAVFEVAESRTVFPVPYRRNGTEFKARPVSAEPGAPWAIVRRSLSESLERMRGESPYRARVGVHSGGAAGVFWVDVLERGTDLVRIANRADAGRNFVQSVQTEIEPRYLRKLLRGRDVGPGRAKPSASVVLPYEPVNSGKAVSESDLERECPRTAAYFALFRGFLLDRVHYRHHFAAARGCPAPPWSLYNVGDYTFARHRVVWREQARSLTAAVLDDPEVVPDAKLTLVPCVSADEALYLAALLNSTPARAFVDAYAVRTQISTHVLKYMAVPRFDEANPVHRRLASDAVSPDSLACELWGLDERVFHSEE